mgnify:CR=1 FL=1
MAQAVGEDVADMLVGETVVDDAPGLAPAHDPPVAKQPQLVADGRLAEADEQGEVADAELVGEGQRVEQARARGIGKRGKGRGQGIGLLLLDDPPQQGGDVLGMQALGGGTMRRQRDDICTTAHASHYALVARGPQEAPRRQLRFGVRRRIMCDMNDTDDAMRQARRSYGIERVTARSRRAGTVLAMVAAVTLAGCGGSPPPAERSVLEARVAEVHLSPTCTCCTAYVDYLRRNGWTVEVVEEPDLAAFQDARGIPAEARGCHTTLVDDYTVDGHVPLAAVDELLDERPDVDGIGLPGMPLGSPGMSGTASGPFEVVAFSGDEVTPFGDY